MITPLNYNTAFTDGKAGDKSKLMINDKGTCTGYKSSLIIAIALAWLTRPRLIVA